MAWVQADIDALDAAIAKRGRGETVQQITFSDRTITYAVPPSVDDLLRLRALMIGTVSPETAPPSFRLAATSKGV